jgi:hypothetical protein
VRGHGRWGQSCVDEYRQALADAGKTVLQWIKENGVEILLDVIGYTDLKNCFMTGDVEACLWTLVNAASLAIAVGKLPAVSPTRKPASVGASISTNYKRTYSSAHPELEEKFGYTTRSSRRC